MNENREWIEELKKFPMLEDLPPEDMEVLAALLKPESFSAGSRIIEEGDLGSTMYLLLQGTVEVLKTTLYGEEYVCAKLKHEQRCVFGEIALIDQDRRSATVRAATECRTLSLSREDFRKYCEEHPAAGCRLLMVMSTNLCRNLRKENDNLLKVYTALVEEIENAH